MMDTRNMKPVSVWLTLVLLTVISVAAVEEHVLAWFASAGIFLISAFKAHLILDHFMEVGHAAPHWRFLYRLWIVVVSLMLMVSHTLV